MAKTIILYHSSHHYNTLKVLNAIRKAVSNVRLVDVSIDRPVSLESFDMIGVASGIYYSKFSKDLTDYLRKSLPEGKNVFALYTCGSKKRGYTDEVRSIVEERHCYWLGECGCLGYDTFGPLRLIGGIAKGHPNDADIEKAIQFYWQLSTIAK